MQTYPNPWRAWVYLAAILCGCASSQAGSGPATSGTTRAGARPLPGLEPAAAIAFRAATSDESALPALRGAASTAAQLQALCPTMVIPDQVEPTLVMRYIETQCRDLSGDCVDQPLDDSRPRAAFTFVPVDPAWWSGQGCPDVKVSKIAVATPLECTTLHGCYADQKEADLHEAICEACHEQGGPADEGSDVDTDAEGANPCAEVCGACGWGETDTFFMDDVFAVQHPGGTNLVWSFKGFDEAMVTREPLDVVPGNPRSLMSYDAQDELKVEVFFCGAHATSGI